MFGTVLHPAGYSVAFWAAARLQFTITYEFHLYMHTGNRLLINCYNTQFMFNRESMTV
jgi:hypothetical protein